MDRVTVERRFAACQISLFGRGLSRGLGSETTFLFHCLQNKCVAFEAAIESNVLLFCQVTFVKSTDTLCSHSRRCVENKQQKTTIC